jgi:hypothetical protein
MLRSSLLAATLAAILTAPAPAGTFDLSLTGDGDGRWFEYFSDAFAQIDRGFDGDPALDGFFLISALPGFTPIGGGADVFPFEQFFTNIGSIDHDGPDGGTGTFSITGLTLDFAPFVADDDSLLNTGYTTSVSNVSGSISFVGGIASAISLTSDITFTYDATSSGLGLLPYDGTFSIAGDRFTLLVDDTNSTAFGDFRYAWDIEGTVDGVAGVIPEPSSLALAAVGLAGIGLAGLRRRRRGSAAS